MAWKTPVIVLSRDAVAQYVDPALWSQIGLAGRRRIATLIAVQEGESDLATALAQGNPNLCDIQMETDFPLPA